MTLMEVLVAMALFVLVLFLVLTTLHSMRKAFEFGDGRIVLQQRARTAFARIAPILVTAVAPDESTQAIDFPPVVESFDGESRTSLRFYSPIDFFGLRRLPVVREPQYFHYEIFFRDNTILLMDLERTKFAPRVLASKVDSFAVRRVQLNAVNLEVGVSLGKTRKEFRLETLVQIPFYAN